MLEVVIPGIRYGEGKINSSSAYRGCHCYIAGVDASGYQLLQVAYTTADAAKSIYPVNKYYFSEDLNDTSDAVDKLKKGDTIVYYGGGEYITDKFVQSSFGLDTTYWANVEDISTVGGRKTYVPGSSTAHGTVGLDKIYISSGEGTGFGYLLGSTSEANTTLEGSIGFVTGIYYEDSANARLRYRIAPDSIFGI